MYDAPRDIPPKPERPPIPDPKPGGSFFPIVMVLVPLLLLTIGIVAFTGLAGLLMLAVIASVPAFMMLHYLLWGHWLGKSIRDAHQQETEEGPPED